MDDCMTEKDNGVFELEKEEMARVSGGGNGINSPEKPQINPRLVQEPHCRACGYRVENFSGEYKCTTEWCRLKGKTQKTEDLDWY